MLITLLFSLKYLFYLRVQTMNVRKLFLNKGEKGTLLILCIKFRIEWKIENLKWTPLNEL